MTYKTKSILIGACIIIGVPAGFSILFGAMLNWQVKKDDRRQQVRESNTRMIISKTDYGAGTLFTISHDGHWFVFGGDYRKGGLLHHPDCSCLEE